MKKICLLLSLGLLIILISGCQQLTVREKEFTGEDENVTKGSAVNENTILDKFFCLNNDDCQQFCTLCANKDWLKKNYNLNAEYCPNPPGFDSCLCVENECTRFIQGKKITNPHPSKEFLYQSSDDIIPNEYLIPWIGINYENNIIKKEGDNYYCKESGKNAEIVKYFEGGSKGGFGSFERYAIVCDNQYFIYNYSSAFGPELYGHFQINLE